LKANGEEQTLEALEHNERYKYLGMEQNKMRDMKIMKERLRRNAKD
jgi:hypothetical protein